MQTYIALLRGINVGGHKKILMAELRAHLADSGLKNVKTYIQSGNIVFDSKETPKILSKSIRQSILDNYGFEVPVIVFKQAFLTQVINENPFLLKNPTLDIKMLYVSYLSEKPKSELLEKLKEHYHGDDLFTLSEKVVYLYYKNGAARTKLTNNYMEKQLKLSATSRNWRTTLKLEKM